MLRFQDDAQMDHHERISGVQSTEWVLCSLTTIAHKFANHFIHRSENRHDSTGIALIKSSRMIFMLAARASKWLLWCLRWSPGAASSSQVSKPPVLQCAPSTQPFVYFPHFTQFPWNCRHFDQIQACRVVSSDETASSRTPLPNAPHSCRHVGDSSRERWLVSLQSRGLFWAFWSIFWIQWMWCHLYHNSCLTSCWVLLTVCFSLQVQTSLLWQSKTFWLQQCGNSNEKTL